MKILLGITGSVAATLDEKLINALIHADHEVKVVRTFSSLYFQKKSFWKILFKAFCSKVFKTNMAQSSRVESWTDFDEWPGWYYKKNQKIPHIALRDWADVLVIAPLSANMLAKLANGLCDNLLTCIVRAWRLDKPMIVAPAMNTMMWQHPVTSEHLKRLGSWYKLTVVSPVSKKLACGDTGIGAMAEIQNIVRAIN